MAVGTVSKALLTEIANAIREQNGQQARYMPLEMSLRVLEMDGTLELNYRDGRSSDVEGAVILEGWEIPAEGFSSSSDIPWRTRRSEVLRALIDSDFAGGGLTNASHLFQSLQQMTEVRGFEALEGAMSFDQVFSSCPSLESVYATRWEPAGEQTGSLGLYGCNRLVGGMGYSPDYGEDIDNCPANTMELKRIDSIEAKLSGTFVTLNTALGKKLAAAADETEGKIVPRSALSEEDFADIWLIGDYSGENGNGYIAIRLINALNTGGLQITTQNKAKGQFAFEFTGHYSIKNPEIVPYELYIKQEIGA